MTDFKKSYASTKKLPVFLAWSVIITGVFLHALVFVLFQFNSSRANEFKLDAPFVQFSSSGKSDISEIVREQAALFDSSPLFLPTNWNTASRLDSIISLSSLQKPLFSPFAEKITLSVEQMNPVKKFHTAKTIEPLSAISEFTSPPFYYFEEHLNDIEPLFMRDFALQISYMKSGAIRENINMTLELTPEQFNRFSMLWSPVELQMVIYHSRMIGVPLMLKSSGINEIDQILISRFINRPNFATGLENGHYKIIIGP